MSEERRINTNELAQRVAVLESIIERMKEDMEKLSELLREHMEKEEKERKELLEKITNISEALTKYRGMVGGIILSITAVWALIQFGISYLVKH